MGTKPINQQNSDRKKNFFKSAAPVGIAAGAGAVAGACISSAQTEAEPETKENVEEIVTPLTEKAEPANPFYTGPTYQHDPEADTESENQQQQGGDTDEEQSTSGNTPETGTTTNGGNSAETTTNGGNSPETTSNGGNSPETTDPEEEAAKQEISKDEIDPEDLDEDDLFTVIGFDTRTAENGEEIEVAIVLDANGNQMLMVDTDGNGLYDSLYTLDNDYVGELALESLTKSDLLEKMQEIGYISPIKEDTIPQIPPTSEDIVIVDANDDEIEDIVNDMIDNEQNLMAYTEVDGGNNTEVENPAENATGNNEDDDADVDYDDTVNEEEILAMLDDDVDEEEEESEDDDDDSDDEEDDSLDDDMDLDELDA